MAVNQSIHHVRFGWQSIYQSINNQSTSQADSDSVHLFHVRLGLCFVLPIVVGTLCIAAFWSIIRFVGPVGESGGDIHEVLQNKNGKTKWEQFDKSQEKRAVFQDSAQNKPTNQQCFDLALVQAIARQISLFFSNRVTAVIGRSGALPQSPSQIPPQHNQSVIDDDCVACDESACTPGVLVEESWNVSLARGVLVL